jgi:hypothetical protein
MSSGVCVPAAVTTGNYVFLHSVFMRFTSISQRTVIISLFGLPNRLFLRALEKLRKATISVVMSVRLSLHMEQLGSHWKGFHEILNVYFSNQIYLSQSSYHYEANILRDSVISFSISPRAYMEVILVNWFYVY